MAATAGDEDQSMLQSLMGDLTSSIPGIDEAMSFSELMKQVQSMDYDTVVFDTAPTGHTLRLLSFPTIMEKALGKIMDLKDKFGGMLNSMSGLMGGAAAAGPNGESPTDMMLGKVRAGGAKRLLRRDDRLLTRFARPITNKLPLVASLFAP